MRPIAPEALAYVEQNAPHFIAAVARAKQNTRSGPATGKRSRADRETVRTALGAYHNNMALVYGCLWYADTEGVDVLFASANRRPRG